MMRFLLFILVILISSCGNRAKRELLAGDWQASSIEEEGRPLKVDLEDIRFSFDNRKHYSYESTLRYREAGFYAIRRQYLFTEDTIRPESLEKAVEILRLTADTLELKMMEGGKERKLVMVKEK